MAGPNRKLLSMALLVLFLLLPASAEATWCHDPYPGQCASPTAQANGRVQPFSIASGPLRVVGSVSLAFDDAVPPTPDALGYVAYAETAGRIVVKATNQGPDPVQVVVVVAETELAGLRYQPAGLPPPHGPYDRAFGLPPGESRDLLIPFQTSGLQGNEVAYGVLVLEMAATPQPGAKVPGVRGSLSYVVVPRAPDVMETAPPPDVMETTSPPVKPRYEGVLIAGVALSLTCAVVALALVIRFGLQMRRLKIRTKGPGR